MLIDCCSSAICCSVFPLEVMAAFIWDLFFRYHPTADSGNDGSRESNIPFRPVSICTCTTSINSYRARSVIISPRIEKIITRRMIFFPKCFGLRHSLLFDHWQKCSRYAAANISPLNTVIRNKMPKIVICGWIISSPEMGMATMLSSCTAIRIFHNASTWNVCSRQCFQEWHRWLHLSLLWWVSQCKLKLTVPWTLRVG